jgi:hypothetical protein
MAQGFGQNIQRQSSRVSQLKRKLDGSEDADLIMMNILEVFTESEFIPDVGKYYTFIYTPKTPNITYDEYPLIAVTAVERWGFKGINFHWRQSRQYTWQEVFGKMHLIRNDEIDYIRSLPYSKFITK